MKQVTSHIVFILVLIIATFWASSTHARFSYPDAPPYVRLSGMLLPFGAHDVSELRTLIVLVHDQLWRFRLDAVEGDRWESRAGTFARPQEVLGPPVWR